MTALTRLLRDEQGSGLLEIAACMTAILMIFFGIMDCSRALYADLYVGYAAHSASRYAMVRGSTWNGTACSTSVTANCIASSTDVTMFVQGLAPLGVSTGAPLSVNTTWPGTNAAGASCVTMNGANSPGCVVKVDVSYNFSFVLPFLPKAPFTMKSSSAVTIAQ